MTESDSQPLEDQTKSCQDQGVRPNHKCKSLSQLRIANVAVLLTSLFPLLSSYSSIFELFSHFRLQMLIASIIATVLLVFYQRKSLSSPLRSLGSLLVIPGVMAIVINGFAVYPLYFGQQERAEVPNLRLLTVNLSVDNRDFSRVGACIRDSDADVVCMQELSPEMNDYLAKNLEEYPYRLVDLRRDPFGIGIYSRTYINSNVVIPSESLTFTQPRSSSTKQTINSLMVGITFGDLEVKVICTHPPPPINQNAADWRNRQLEFIAGMAAKSKDPMIVAGDLNCTAYSPYFARTLEQGGLNDTEIGFGIQPTWPTTMLPLIIPIDHVLYKGPIRIVSRRLGLSTGSDHTPVLASFRIGS